MRLFNKKNGEDSVIWIYTNLFVTMKRILLPKCQSEIHSSTSASLEWIHANKFQSKNNTFNPRTYECRKKLYNRIARIKSHNRIGHRVHRIECDDRNNINPTEVAERKPDQTTIHWLCVRDDCNFGYVGLFCLLPMEIGIKWSELKRQKVAYMKMWMRCEPISF